MPCPNALQMDLEVTYPSGQEAICKEGLLLTTFKGFVFDTKSIVRLPGFEKQAQIGTRTRTVNRRHLATNPYCTYSTPISCIILDLTLIGHLDNCNF